MKLIFFLPLLFIISSADQEVISADQEVIAVDQEALINALKKFEGTKIALPKELVERLNLEASNIDESSRAAGITAVIDAYVDRILERVKTFIIRNGLDPAELPDTTLDLIPTGTITLTSGWLQDISTISKNGNSTVSYSSSSRVMEFYLPIKFNAMLVTYKYHTKVLLLSIKGDANGKIENLTVNVKLTYDFSTYQTSLETFEIKDSGRFSLKFTGNDLVDWITNTMTSVVTVFLQPIVIRIVQALIKGGLQTVVDAVNELINSIFTPQ